MPIERRHAHASPGLLCLAGVLLAATDVAIAAEDPATNPGWLDKFRDREDGRFDLSTWLLERQGFLPVPLIITEPAVGYGGGLALAFFHPNDTQGVDGKPTPPNITAVLGLATENGTWAAGGAHLGKWRRNTIQTTTAVIKPSVHIDFYGGGNLPEIPDGLEYKLDGWMAMQTTLFRLKDSAWWAGLQLIYFDATSSLPDAGGTPLADLSGSIDNYAVGAVAQYDSRDNVFSPTRGLEATLRLRHHWGDFRSSFEYPEIELDSRYYFGNGPDWHFGWRAKGSFVGGEAPFYALPFITLRGVPLARYQGEQVLSTEVEARYNIDERWSVLGFGGVGFAASEDSDLFDASDRWAGGAGFRYLIARQLGLLSGIDVARGPEEWAFYIQFGSAWNY